MSFDLRRAWRAAARASLALTLALGLAVGVAASATPARAQSASQIEEGADAALDELYARRPDLRRLGREAVAILIVPNVIRAGVLIGGAYGEGALQVDGATISYWAYRGGSVGVQIGAQRSRHVLFFLSTEALAAFTNGDQVRLGVDIDATVVEARDDLSIERLGDRSVVWVEFDQSGLLGGASLGGGSYARITR